MKVIRSVWTLILSLALLFISLASSAARTQAQGRAATASEAVTNGIKLYQDGKTQEAIAALRLAVKQSPKEADAWHYLGLALFREGNAIEARKAFEKALKLRPNHAADRANLAHMLLLANKPKEAVREAERALKVEPQNIEAHYIIGAVSLKIGDRTKALAEAETMLKLQPNFARAYLLKSLAQLGLFAQEYSQMASKPPPNRTPEEKEQLRRARYSSLKNAAENLATYLKLNPDGQEANLWREQLDGLQTYVQALDPANDKKSIIWSESGVRPTILYKERAKYTEEARNAGVTGSVLLMAIFAADGQLKHIIVLKGLPYGLSEQAVKAARKITFTPAMKDGHPISVVAQIEFNFALY